MHAHVLACPLRRDLDGDAGVRTRPGFGRPRGSRDRTATVDSGAAAQADRSLEPRRARYRGAPSAVPRARTVRCRIRSFIHQYVRSYPFRDASVVEGVLETYCTTQPSLTAPFLRNGRRYPSREHRVVPRRIRQLAHRRYLKATLKRAVDGDREVHLWTHPYNLSNESQWPPIRSFLTTLAEYRDKGAVEIRTMRDLGTSQSFD